MKHFTVIFEPDNRQVSIHEGATLTEAAGRAGIILNSVCGGKGVCRKCLVVIQPQAEQVPACRYHVESDITVTVPATSRFFGQRILTEGATQTEIKPDIYRKYVQTAAGGQIFGVAVDIGTTTVVAKLVNMTDGQCEVVQAAMNPQARYGDDVISRISYGQSDDGLSELHEVIIDCINGLIGGLCRQGAVQHNEIYEMSVVGNTTMNHIFLKLPVAQLGQAPYKAFSLEAHDRGPEQMGLEINAAGNIHTIENIAGFVGADTTGMALATGIDSGDEITLAVDIGTNGELVLAAGKRLYAASCAAGPAFEGARIGCGSRAVEGAIQAVIENGGDIDLDVIGDCPPRSICGSGLADAVAVLLNSGVIDATGRFANPGSLEKKLPPVVFSRIIEHCGQPGFVLAYGREADGEKVVLTQEDIRHVQLAKGAIRAGTKLLLTKVGIDDADVERILLAGAFGNYIRPESAIRIGLLPAVPAERIHFVGNAACTGAEMALLSSRARKKARQLARTIEYVEIAHEKEFGDVFADCMMF